MTHAINRRDFLGYGVAGGALLGAHMAGAMSSQTPGRRVVLGVAGMSRGRALAVTFAQQADCVVKYVCDTDSDRAAAGAAAVAGVSSARPEAVADLRRMLDDPDVDAVALALPVHWHGPGTIMACQAGKHVYVEKPCCHNPREGELMVEAARKHGRVVQMGNQRRSSKVIREAITRLHEGVIGRAYYARGWYAAQRGSIGQGRNADAPPTLNYDLWQGPAPRMPYRDNVIHYNWHWFWHWGTGEMGNNGTHVVDLCRWGLEVDYPTRVTAAGGRFRFDDDQETPDTHLVTYDFAGGKTASWEGLSCNQPGSGGSNFGATFFGEGGSLTVGSTDYALRDSDGVVLEEHGGDLGGVEHIENFLDAIRNDRPDSLNSDIESGHQTTLLSHLGNIAYRTGRTLQCGEKGRILHDEAAAALWRREYEPGWEPQV